MTTELLTAHELGHAAEESQYLYDDDFFNNIDEFNKLSSSVYNEWQRIIFTTAKLETKNNQQHESP